MNNFEIRLAAMLAPILTLTIALLLALTCVVAMLAIADSVMKARHAYQRLMREAALMQAGFAVQVEARELRMRRAPERLAVRVTPLRRSQALRTQALPAPAGPAYAAV
jgi:hypothetical protein